MSTAQEQLDRARQAYPFLPESVEIAIHPDGIFPPRFDSILPGGTAHLTLGAGATFTDPLDPVLAHELAHAGHALIRRASGLPWFAQVLASEVSSAQATDPTLRAFWDAMAYTTPLEDACRSALSVHDWAPMEHFAEAFKFIACPWIEIGPDGGIWARYGGNLNARRAALDAFFRSLMVPPVLNPSVPATVPTTQPIEVQWRGPLPGSNFMPTRGGNPTTMIIDHWMAGTYAGADDRFHDPASRVSAHYGVLRDGRVVQWVADSDTAYHAGNWTTNLLSIGIEHEASPTAPFTDAGYAASARLHRYLSERYSIPLDRAHVKGHKEVSDSPTACPGTLDLDRLIGGSMDRATFNQWWLEQYAQVGAAKKFDDLAALIGEANNAADAAKATASRHIHKTGEPEVA